MDESIRETIRQIKTEFRLGMNGVASASMREKGLLYKVNFGIEIPRLRMIASGFAPSARLAQALWQEDIRESRILATMLMPLDEFPADLADVWVEQIPNQEIAEILVMNLLSKEPYAADMALGYLASGQETRIVCALLILTRLVMSGTEFSESCLHEIADQSVCLMQDKSQRIARQAFILLSRLAATGDIERGILMQYLPEASDRMSAQLKGWIEALRS